ncbi:MAG: VCBS repeat-containing protein [Trueperaceae bacterium]
MRSLMALGAMLMLAMSTARAEVIVSANYEAPVERYGHFALGRPHEYARVVARTDAGRHVALELPDDEVFEDLAPRLVRLTEDGPTLLLAIVSARGVGARLALLGLDGDALEVVAQSAPIGSPHRWLNPVGVADLDGDGVAEIAAVTTPHIGGVLRVYRRDGERLVELASLTGFSNHAYRSPELELSRPARIDDRMQLLVPDMPRTAVRVIALDGDRLVDTDRCELAAPITGPDALRACEAQLTGAP